MLPAAARVPCSSMSANSRNCSARSAFKFLQAAGPTIAVATVLGTATGLIIWSAAAGAGLSAVVLADPTVYRVLVGGGGAFLAVVGVRTVWSAARGKEAHTVEHPPTAQGRRGAFLTGLATNLGNPKAGIFAISLLPGFAGGAAGAFWPTLTLGLVWSAVTAAWYFLFVALVAHGRSFVTRPGAQRAVGGLSGVVLVGVGATVAFGL
jgi:threonine/homoserine/homoserine lactone efflux protein